jgi:hypothetical protein
LQIDLQKEGASFRRAPFLFSKNEIVANSRFSTVYIFDKSQFETLAKVLKSLQRIFVTLGSRWHRFRNTIVYGGPYEKDPFTDSFGTHFCVGLGGLGLPPQYGSKLKDCRCCQQFRSENAHKWSEHEISY